MQSIKGVSIIVALLLLCNPLTAKPRRVRFQTDPGVEAVKKAQLAAQRGVRKSVLHHLNRVQMEIGSHCLNIAQRSTAASSAV